MAQLPPKIPSAPQNHWPPFASPHQRMPPVGSFAPAGGGFGSAQSSWADEFVEFASARRGAHRRSASDTIAFLDDEQLMSMFSDDVGAPPTGSNSSDSTPSDQNSNNDDQKAAPPLDQPKSEPGEVESTCIPDLQAAGHSTGGASAVDAIVDPKRIKRILANRQSAQRSRVRKLQYISELERSVTTLQSEVSALSPRVAFLDHQRLILNVDNSALKQRIAALAQDKIFKDAHQEALKKEIERLRQLYQQQQKMKKINGGGAAANNRHPPPLSGQNVQQQQEQKFLSAPDQAMSCTEN